MYYCDDLDNRIGEAIRRVIERDCQYIGEPDFHVIVVELIDEHQACFEEWEETWDRINQDPTIHRIFDRCRRWDDYASRRRAYHLEASLKRDRV